MLSIAEDPPCAAPCAPSWTTTTAQGLSRLLHRISQLPDASPCMLYRGGRCLTVERHFNRSGTSRFKLKDQNGRVVSTEKAELEDILDAFSMQIDNAMNVLT